MLQLIINADDFGLTPGCNAGIIRAMTQGIVSDTTLMVNTAYTADAVTRLKNHGISRVGLHLNLTFGKPLLPAAAVPSLVDGSGFFRRGVEYAVPLMDPAEAQRELSAQVETFLATGLGLTHLDSHHHVHSYPKIFAIVMDLAGKLDVPVRQTGETIRQSLLDVGVATTDHIALDFYSHDATIENLKAIISRHSHGTMEIMCHPAEPDPLLYEISSYHSWREKELAILTSQEMIAFIKEREIRLAVFDMLR